MGTQKIFIETVFQICKKLNYNFGQFLMETGFLPDYDTKNEMHLQSEFKARKFSIISNTSQSFSILMLFLIILTKGFLPDYDTKNEMQTFSNEEQQLIEDYRALNYSGKKLVKQPH